MALLILWDRMDGIQTNKYMNSGVLLINSKAIRRDRIEEKIIDFVNTHNYLPHHD